MGNADYHEKYLRYAEIFPQLCGNPLYYWTQMELSLLFGIHLPLGPDTAEEIWDTANRALAGMRVRDILNRFRVRYIATTDDPVSPLNWHGVYGDTTVAPTFRPDRMLSLDADALTELAVAADIFMSSAVFMLLPAKLTAEQTDMVKLSAAENSIRRLFAKRLKFAEGAIAEVRRTYRRKARQCSLA